MSYPDYIAAMVPPGYDAEPCGEGLDYQVGDMLILPGQRVV